MSGWWMLLLAVMAYDFKHGNSDEVRRAVGAESRSRVAWIAWGVVMVALCMTALVDTYGWPT